MNLLDYTDVPARNDVYGKMFFYLRDMLVKFQRKKNLAGYSVGVYGEDFDGIRREALKLNNTFATMFDRIEVSCDEVFFINHGLSLTKYSVASIGISIPSFAYSAH